MDFVSTFKSEIFKPLATVIVPGATAIAPWILITGYYIPRVPVFWDEHPSAFVAILIVCVMSAGLVLEDVGALVEKKIGERLKSGDVWHEYLKLKLKDEMIGQRYLQSIVVRLKFELAMPPALLSLLIGLIWLECLYHIWSRIGMTLVVLFVTALAAYLFFESYQSSKVLKETRQLIVDASTRQLIVDPSKK